jgi:hypothetical protein
MASANPRKTISFARKIARAAMGNAMEPRRRKHALSIASMVRTQAATTTSVGIIVAKLGNMTAWDSIAKSIVTRDQTPLAQHAAMLFANPAKRRRHALRIAATSQLAAITCVNRMQVKRLPRATLIAQTSTCQQDASSGRIAMGTICTPVMRTEMVDLSTTSSRHSLVDAIPMQATRRILGS